MAAFQFSRKQHKYGARQIDGFPSMLERAVFFKLKDQETLGLIADIKRQQTVVLIDCDKCGTKVQWKVDFSFLNKETGEIEFAEAKGAEDMTYRKKVKLWRKNPPAALTIWKGSWRYPKIAERIEAKP